MVSLALSAPTTPAWSARLPTWALSGGRNLIEPNAAFVAGIALKSLDDPLRADPPWLGCWRDRPALRSAAVAARMVGRGEDENTLRDAVLLTGVDGDPGPAGKLFLATRMLARRSAMITTPLVKELCDLLGIRWDNALASVPDLVDFAISPGGRRLSSRRTSSQRSAQPVRIPRYWRSGWLILSWRASLTGRNRYRCCYPNAMAQLFGRSAVEAVSGQESRVIQK